MLGRDASAVPTVAANPSAPEGSSGLRDFIRSRGLRTKKAEGEQVLPLCYICSKQVVRAYFSNVIERVAVNSPASIR